MHRLPLAATVGALAVLAAPSAAHAAAVVVQECSVTLPGQQTVAIRGTGFTPGSTVSLRADDQPLGAGVPVDAAGAFSAASVAPELSSPRRNLQTFRLTATDAAGVAAAAPLQITRVTATLPERARPRSRVRFGVFGFAPGRPVYLHVRRAGRTRGTFHLGTATAPCGRVSRRLRYMPLRRWSTGTYEYVFQLGRRYRSTAPSVRLRVSIVRNPAAP